MALRYISSLAYDDWMLLNSGSAVQSTDEPRFNANSLKVDVTSGGTGYVEFGEGLESTGGKVDDNFSVIAHSLTFWIKIGSLPTDEVSILDGVAADIQLDENGDVWLDGSTDSSVAATLSADDTWHRIDVYLEESSTCKLSVDGGATVTCSGSSGSGTFRIGVPSNSTSADALLYFCDLWLADTEDEYAPNDGGVYLLLPNADGGDSSGWDQGTGSTYTEVDDALSFDFSSGWVSNSGSTNKRSVGFESLPSSSVEYDVAAATLHAWCRNNTSQSDDEYQPYLDDGTESATSGTAHLSGTTQNELVKSSVTQPSGGAWTETAVNALEGGMMVDTASSRRVFLLWLEVWAAEETIEGTGATSNAAQVVAATGSPTVEGTASASNAAQGVSASGSPVVQGTAASAAVAQTTAGSGPGGVPIEGTGATTAAAQQVSATGSPIVQGTAAASNPAQSIAATGSVDVEGTGATTNSAQQVAATGGPVVQGSAQAASAAQQTAGVGIVPVSAGDASTESPAHVTAGSGIVPVQGTAALANPAPVIAAAGGPVVEAVAATVSAAQQTSATGDVPIQGTAATQAAAQALSASGGPEVQGQAQTAAAAQQAAVTGGPVVQGTAALTSAAQINTGSGIVPVQGAAALVNAVQTLAAAGQAISGGDARCQAAAQVVAATGGPVAQGHVLASNPPQVVAALGGPVVQGACTTVAAAQACAGTGEAFSFSTRAVVESEVWSGTYDDLETVV